MKLITILVPLRGADGEAEVLDLAFTLVMAAGVQKRARPKLHLIHIVEVPQALPLDCELTEAIAAGEAVLARAEQLAAARDIEVDADLLQARQAGVAIVDEAVARRADLILLGARYRRRHGEFDLGETLPYVFKHAPCRVWVARAPLVGADLTRGTLE